MSATQDDDETPPDDEVVYVPIEREIENAEAAVQRARVPVVIGAVLIVAMTIGVLAAEGLPGGIRGVGLVVEMLVVFATFFFLLKLVKALRYLRTIDAAVNDDADPPDPEAVALATPATAEWFRVRSARATKLSVVALVSFAGMVVSGAFIGGDGDEDPNHLAFSIALVLFLIWGFTGFAAGISLLGKRAYRRRLQRHPWREVRCELGEAADRPSLGGPPPLVAVVELEDGRVIELALRMMVMWSPLPVRVDGQVHTAWWCSKDDETGALAGAGGAPVVLAGLVPAYIDQVVQDAFDEEQARKKQALEKKPSLEKEPDEGATPA